jgi:ribonuclease P protein subunit RPR2
MQTTNKVKEIARERISILFEQAATIFKTNKSLSNRYVLLARKIAMKSNIQLTKVQKTKFCKHCYSFLKPGINSRVRINNNKLIVFCTECKKYSRMNL